MAYSKQTWTNGSGGGTPLSAARLQHIEDGVEELSDDLYGLGIWQTYTPSLSGITLGNGTLTGRYTQIGKTVFFYASVALGSTSAITGTIQFSIPVTASGSGWQGAGILTDTGTTYYMPLVFTGSTFIQLWAANASGTYVSRTATSATVPFTWTTGDLIQLSGTYEAA